MGRAASVSVSHGTKLYNESPDSITNDSANEYIQAIDADLQAGFGFIPFIGAGFSAPSGAPLVWDLAPYLHRCVWMALGCDMPGARPWNPRTDQWPPFSHSRPAPETDYWDRIRYELAERKSRNQWAPEVKIFQEALGAMAEWRTSLLYLSRIVVEQRGTVDHPQYQLALDAPNQDVIDGCLRHTMRGKHPTIGHRMLATLAPLLRLNVVLTTNFDDLLEQAFEAARNPLTVFEVHLNSDLPPYSAVSAHRALVKMHGNLYSLRVDYTLDALPKEMDRQRFLEYLRGTSHMYSVDADRFPVSLSRPYPPHRNQLLVMGVSAADRRTRDFVTFAWKRLAPTFKVYWLCYSRNDVETVQAFTREFKENHPNDSRFNDPQWEGSRVLRYSQTGLLLLQLYQTIRCGIPTTGIIFPSASRLAIPPMKGSHSASSSGSSLNAFADVIHERLCDIQKSTFHSHRLMVVTAAPDATGVTTACATVFDRIQDEHQHTVWLEMNDVSSTDDLFEQLMDAVCYRLGIENWLPNHVEKRAKPRSDEIRTLAGTVSGNWTFFLNVRETPGTNVADRMEVFDDESHPNNWLDWDGKSQLPASQRVRDDQSNTLDRFVEFLSHLCAPHIDRRVQQPNPPSVIILCRRQNSGEPSNLEKALIETHRLTPASIIPSESVIEFDEIDVAIDTLKWLTADPDTATLRTQFLHALLLLQRTRYLATVWGMISSGTENGTVDVRYTPHVWLDDLENIGLVRRKPGGFVWLHARTRTRLRELFRNEAARDELLKQLNRDLRKRAKELKKAMETLTASRTTGSWHVADESLADKAHTKARDRLNAAEKAIDKCFAEWDPRLQMPAVHSRLAHWYRRVFEASRAPAAVFEAAYHSCRSAETTFLLPALALADIHTAIDQLNWSSSMLQTHSFVIQTQGYSRGSCRKLSDIREQWCDRIEDAIQKRLDGTFPDAQADCKPLLALISALRVAVRLLRIRCTELMRAIAREVGEDFRAYQRHLDLRKLLTGQSLADRKDHSDHFIEHFILNAVQQPSATIEWIRWWRWTGMLGIASRSYHSARSALYRTILSVTEPLFGVITKARQLPVSYLDKKLPELLNRLVEATATNTATVLDMKCDSQQLRLEMARAIEQLVALALLESSLARRLLPRTERDEVRRDCEGNSFHLINAGLALVEQALAMNAFADTRDSTIATWCRCRLLMHHGILLARRFNYSDAIRHMADAEATLNPVGSNRRGVDSAVIELHRAEVMLLQAESVQIPIALHGQRTQIAFEDLGAELVRQNKSRLKWSPDADSTLWRETAAMMLREMFPTTDSLVEERNRSLQTAGAFVQDAVAYLMRAETILLARRRSVWWSTWYFQRRLKTISMSIWATLFDQTPIPIVGVEAAPRGTLTLADRILEQAQRMIRVDAYRLATVLEEYANCARAYYTRMLLDPSVVADRMHSRQLDMRANIIQASDRLRKVVELRGHELISNIDSRISNLLHYTRDDAPSASVADELESLRRKRNAVPSEDVQKYVSHVLSVAADVAEYVQQPLL